MMTKQFEMTTISRSIACLTTSLRGDKTDSEEGLPQLLAVFRRAIPLCPRCAHPLKDVYRLHVSGAAHLLMDACTTCVILKAAAPTWTPWGSVAESRRRAVRRAVLAHEPSDTQWVDVPPRLTRVYMEANRDTLSMALTVAHRCGRHLAHVHVSYSNINNTDEAASIAEDFLRALGVYCPELTSIEVSCPPGPQRFCAELAQLVRQRPRLRRLHLTGLYADQVDGLLDALAASCPNLTSLSCEPLLVSTTANTNNALQHLAVKCPRLRELTFHDVEQNHVSVVEAIAKICQTHRFTLLGMNRSVSNRRDDALVALDVVALHAGHLRSLCLRRDDDLARDAARLLAFTMQARWLEDLDISGTETTDEGVGYVAQHCGYLTCLDVTGTYVTGKGVAHIAKGCPLLRTLCASHLGGEPHAGLAQVGIMCPCLTRLEANSARIVTDDTIKAIADGCTNLLHLSIKDCNQLSNDALMHVARHCGRLRTLNASRVGFSDSAVVELTRGCGASLVRLSISAANALDESAKVISDVALHAIAERCPGLVSLNIAKCVVTAPAVRAVVAACPFLETLMVRSGVLSESTVDEFRTRGLMVRSF